MKTLLALFLVGISIQVNSQSRTITVRILDSQNKKPVKNAIIKIGELKSYSSNPLGYFQAEINDEDKMFIGHESYATGEFKIPEQDSFVVLLDRYYTNLGLLALSKDSSNITIVIDDEVRRIDSALIYKDNWQTLFKDLNERIVNLQAYIQNREKFTIEVLFTVSVQGIIEEVAIIDEFLPQSEGIKEVIRSSMLGTWASSQTPKYSLFFKAKITNEEVMFSVVEESARPANGMNGFYEYVMKKLEYPKDARKLGIEGKIFVQFVIEKDGRLSNVEVIKGIGYGCDEEAIRVVQNSPYWIPAQQKGRPVRQRYVIPIFFKLK